MRHPKVIEWERRLKAIFDAIDVGLEQEYGTRYSLHPARPRHGATSSREHDGLFEIGAGFTGGFGSEHGPGYIVDVRLATLDRVPAEVRRVIEEKVVRRLREELPRVFPGRNLQVKPDGAVYKIFGDLSLGNV